MQVEVLIAHEGRNVGDVVDLPDSEAVRLVCGRWAIPAKPKIERAVKVAAVETREAPKAKGKAKK
jgi:hypothetical protein